jgi:hypothetical protein
MEDYIFDLWINSDTKTDSRLVVGNKVASIFLQLKKETNLKSSDLIKTKYSQFIELYNKPNTYILKQKCNKSFVTKYCEISVSLKYKIDTFKEWMKFNYKYFDDEIFYNPINQKRYTREFISKKQNKKIVNINHLKTIKTYIIKDDLNNTYKIGRSIDPLKREKTLQSEKPNLKLIKIFENNIEKELHDLYKHCRLRGEWFNLNKVQLEYICTNYA